jgi:hypothetical protein
MLALPTYSLQAITGIYSGIWVYPNARKSHKMRTLRNKVYRQL